MAKIPGALIWTLSSHYTAGMKRLGTMLIALTTFCSLAANAADGPIEVTAVSHPGAADLACPEASAPKPRPPAPAAQTLPTAEDLGDLLRPLPVVQPAIDPGLVAGFALMGRRADPAHLRIAMWGDSHVASGAFADELARAIGAQGAEVESTYLPVTMGRTGVRLPLRKYCIAKTWHLEPAYRSPSAGFPSGPSLVNLRSNGVGSYLWLDLRTGQRLPRVRQLRILYLPTDTAATISLSIDDGEERFVRLPPVAPYGNVRSAELEIAADALLSTVKLQVIEGAVVLQGLMLTYQDPRPVTLDVFAFPSATVRGWAQIDVPFLKDSLRGTSYDAVILEYGTNEGNDIPFDRNKYAAVLSRALAAFRDVFPDSACLLLGPTDRGVQISRAPARRLSRRRVRRPAVDWLRYSRIHHEISRVQAEIGPRYRCAAWDWQSFMGGPGSIYRWASSTPPLAAQDLTHLTPAGYRRSAAAVARVVGWGSDQEGRVSQLAGPSPCDSFIRNFSPVYPSAPP